MTKLQMISEITKATLIEDNEKIRLISLLLGDWLTIKDLDWVVRSNNRMLK